MLSSSGGPYKRTYGKCGIIMARLVDPLSQLISKISGQTEDEINAIGFYYEAEIHGVNKITVTLFNTYDNDPIPWLRLGYTIDLLLGSPFVTKIVFYPFVNTAEKGDIEDIFRAAVISTIHTNAKSHHDKNISYTSLLFQIADISDENADRLFESLLTGYCLVNKVLLTMMGISSSDWIKIKYNLISSPLLQSPVTIIAPHEKGSDIDLKYVIEESRREITKLTAIFIDLFTSHEQFRTHILNRNFEKKKIPDLVSIFSLQNDLISQIGDGLEHGIISRPNLTRIIQKMITVQKEMGYSNVPLIPASTCSEIKVTDGDIMCSFPKPDPISQLDPMFELGKYIEYIATDPSTINIGTLITLYNNVASSAGTQSLKLNFPISGSFNVSTTGTVIVPGDTNYTNLIVPGASMAIPMYHANLSGFTQDQLLDVLVYIDSLRSNDGTHDTRFSSLQNEITRELGNRKFGN